MLSGDDIQILLEARRLGFLTAAEADRCLQEIVEAERKGARVDVMKLLATTTSLTPPRFEQLRRESLGISRSGGAISPHTPSSPAPRPPSRKPRSGTLPADAVPVLLEARRLGYLSAAEVDRCLVWLVEAEKKGKRADVWELLASKNLLTPAQAAAVRAVPGNEAHELPQRRSSALPRPGEWLGDYLLLRQVAKGGMGVLFEAARRGAGSGTLALKVFAPPGDPSPRVLQRFRHEAGLAAALDHPNIIKIHEVGRDRGHDFIVMDFLVGRPLSQLLVEGLVTPKKAVKIIATCARAANYMHDRGVIHRDLKPANIMVGQRKVWIVDFGLAKDSERSSVTSTHSGELIGTPAFMAPEQARGEVESIGPWTDIFALAATLYRAIAGTYWFEARTLWETVTKIANDPIPPLHTRRPDVPRQLSNVVAKGMSRQCEDRPSGEEFARRLLHVLETHDLRIPAALPDDEY